MNHFRNSGRVAFADSAFLADDINLKKMLFLFIAACVLYSDYYASPPSIGHCAAISSH